LGLLVSDSELFLEYGEIGAIFGDYSVPA